jgi:hypothetical protein
MAPKEVCAMHGSLPFLLADGFHQELHDVLHQNNNSEGSNPQHMMHSKSTSGWPKL